STTGGPMVRLGTKWPSMTSRCNNLAPPRSTRAISSARRAKSADRIDGTISTICGLFRFYHSGEEAVARVAAGNAAQGLDEKLRRNCGGHRFVLLGFQRASSVDQQTAWRQGRSRIRKQRRLPPWQILQVGGHKPPLDFGITAQGAGAGAGS